MQPSNYIFVTIYQETIQLAQMLTSTTSKNVLALIMTSTGFIFDDFL